MIRLCKYCETDISTNAAGQWTHAFTSSTTCQEQLPGFDEKKHAEVGIEAWETKHGDFVVVGSSKRKSAAQVMRRFYEQLGEVPEGLESAINRAEPFWVNRDDVYYSEEEWPKGVSSKSPRTGDTPAFSWGW